MFIFPPNFNPGAKPRSLDARDVPFSALIPKAYTIDWTHGYDVLKALGYDMPVKNQNGSLSCVGQASAYLAQIQEFVETKNHVELSAKDIYSRIYIGPEGGAYGYKGLSAITARGIAQDTLVPSNEGGQPPSEAYMRLRDDSDTVTKNALIRKARGYAYIDMSNPDELAYAIQQNHGAVFGALGDNEGWQTGYPVPPKSATPWGHFLVLTGFKEISGKKMFWGLNSWGESWGVNGFYFITEEYLTGGWAFNAMTLADLPNNRQEIINMKRIIKLVDSQDVYVVEGGRKMKVPDFSTFEYLRDEVKIITGSPEVVEKAEFDALVVGKSMPSVVGDQFVKDAYVFFKDRLPLLKDIVEAE